MEIKDRFWIEAARDILTGAIVFFFHKGVGFIDTMMIIAATPLSKLLSYIVTDKQAAACFDDSVVQSPRTASGVRGEIIRNITIFATDPLVQEVLSPSEDGSKTPIKWEDLDKGDIFVRIDQSRLEQLGGVLRLMMVQLTRTLERRPEKFTTAGKGITPTLLLLDEFPQYGKMDSLTSSMKVLRSKNVTFCLMCQSLADLDVIYGKDARRAILDNCPYQAVLGAHDYETQEDFSKLVGTIRNGVEGVTDTYDANAVQTGFSISINESIEPAIPPYIFGQLQEVILIHPGPGGYVRLRKETKFQCNPPEEPTEEEDADDETISA